jgi:hypothetical protein
VRSLVLASAALFAASAEPALADVPTGAGRSSSSSVQRDVPVPSAEPDSRAPLPGTAEEADDYARREAESPEVQKFAGGFIIFLLVVAVLILVIILLARAI